MEKSQLVAEINRLITNNLETDEGILSAEKLLLSYLSVTPDDLEVWHLLGILELEPPLVDFESSIKYLNQAWELHESPLSLILIANIQDIHYRFIEDNIVHQIEILLNKTKEPSMVALLNYCIGLYNFDNENFDKAELHFIKSITEFKEFVNAHYKLYQIYSSNDFTKSQAYLRGALQQVKTILKTTDIVSSENSLSLNSFIDEIIYGYRMTEVNYNSMRSLLKE